MSVQAPDMSIHPGCVYVQASRLGRGMYYCPKCDRTIPKERIESVDRELRSKFGISKLSILRCPVCDTEYIDLDKCSKEGVHHVGKSRQKGDAH